MKRYSSAPCLEDVGNEAKKTRGVEQEADPNTQEYLQLALARVLELQRQLEEGTYAAEIDNESNDRDVSDSEEELTKEILTKVFQDLPGTSNSVSKIMNRDVHWNNHRIDAIRSKRIELLGFDTCRRMTLDFMKRIVRGTRNKSSSLETDEFNCFDLPLSRNETLYPVNGISMDDLRKPRSGSINAQEIRVRMLRSLDLHLAAKQKDYTAKLMRSVI